MINTHLPDAAKGVLSSDQHPDQPLSYLGLCWFFWHPHPRIGVSVEAPGPEFQHHPSFAVWSWANFSASVQLLPLWYRGRGRGVSWRCCCWGWVLKETGGKASRGLLVGKWGLLEAGGENVWEFVVWFRVRKAKWSMSGEQGQWSPSDWVEKPRGSEGGLVKEWEHRGLLLVTGWVIGMRCCEALTADGKTPSESWKKDVMPILHTWFMRKCLSSLHSPVMSWIRLPSGCCRAKDRDGRTREGGNGLRPPVPVGHGCLHCPDSALSASLQSCLGSGELTGAPHRLLQGFFFFSLFSLQTACFAWYSLETPRRPIPAPTHLPSYCFTVCMQNSITAALRSPALCVFPRGTSCFHQHQELNQRLQVTNRPFWKIDLVNILDS